MSVVNPPVAFDQPRGLPSAPFVFAGGGTGGHLYPALALAEAFRRRLSRARFLFLGTQRSIEERILQSADCDWVPQSLPALRRAPWRWPGICRGFWRSAQACRARFEADPPAVVIGNGGLPSVPAVREAARMGIPVVLLNPDAVPGRANRYLAGLAHLVFAQWEETIGHLSATVSVRVCGCPVREAFNRPDREAGLRRFGLDGARRTLLVTGASQGARTVNEAVVANLDFLESRSDWQVLHLTGDADHETVRRAYHARSVPAKVLPFTHHMADALAAADLVVARAGASTLAEITAVGRASILMPYPHHRDMHQLANARCLVSAKDGSAARIVHDRADASLNGPALGAVLEHLMTDDDAREALAAAARRMGRGQAADEIADHILGLAEVRSMDESLEASCERTRYTG